MSRYVWIAVTCAVVLGSTAGCIVERDYHYDRGGHRHWDGDRSDGDNWRDDDRRRNRHRDRD